MVLNFKKSMDGSIDSRVIDRAGRKREREREQALEKMSESERLLPSLHLVPLIWRPLIPPNTRQTPHASELAQSPALTLEMCVCACARMC